MKVLDTIFKYIPVPKYLSMSHVGVDISPTAIRFVSLQKTTHGLRLADFAEQPLPTPLLQFENLRSNKEVAAALRKLQRAKRLSLVEVSIPEDRAYLFTTEIQYADDATMRSTIEFHLEENVPISLSDAVFDYQVIHVNEKTNMAHLSVSVVPKVVIDDYLGLFNDCGMTPVSFLIENQALSKALIKKGDKCSYLIVNLGLNRTVLSIVSEDMVQFTSTVNIGSNDFTIAIMKEFNVSKEEAEKIKQEKGFSRSKENEQVFLSLINTVSALKDEINRIFMYWQSYQDKMKATEDVSPLNTIILAGRDSSLSGFREYIALSIKINVELANVWSNIFSFDKEIPPIEYLESLNYGTAIGLAIPKQTN